MPIIDIEQRSPEWVIQRCGMATATGVHRIIKRVGKTKANPEGRYSDSRETYMWEKIAERLTGRSANHFVTADMQWGIDHEDEARTEYELATGNTVRPGKFAIHDDIGWFGASADGLINDDGGLELKCLTTKEHLQCIETGDIPEEYFDQCKANISCYNRQWWDFMAYDPRVQERYQRFIRRVWRDAAMIKQMEDEVRKFLAEVEGKINGLGTKLMVQTELMAI